MKRVSPETKELLGIGNAVIKEVRSLLYYGSANQWAQANVENTLRTSLSRLYINMMQASRTQENLSALSIRTLAFGGIANQAGNCGEMAAVSYTILRSWPEDFDVCFVGVDIEANHNFITIGSPMMLPHNQVVVVDAWPDRPQAVLLEDHFCCSEKLHVMRVGKAGKIGNYNRMMEKYNDGWRAAVLNTCISEGLDIHPLSFMMSNRQTCTSSGEVVEYSSI